MIPSVARDARLDQSCTWFEGLAVDLHGLGGDEHGGEAADAVALVLPGVIRAALHHDVAGLRWTHSPPSSSISSSPARMNT